MTRAGTGCFGPFPVGCRSLGIIDEAMAQEQKGLTFLQISDSHMRFDKRANPNAMGTSEEAIGRIKTLPAKPSFMIHTGDIPHLSKPTESDDADKIISSLCPINIRQSCGRSCSAIFSLATGRARDQAGRRGDDHRCGNLYIHLRADAVGTGVVPRSAVITVRWRRLRFRPSRTGRSPGRFGLKWKPGECL
jgi:hypothetical protein